MTISEFISKLEKKTDIKWNLDENNAIRTFIDEIKCCPITCFNPHRYEEEGITAYKKVGYEIGLNSRQSSTIVLVSDCINLSSPEDNYVKNIRFKLLKACRLQ